MRVRDKSVNVWDVFCEGVEYGVVINEAYILLGLLRPGEHLSTPTYEHGLFHLLALDREFPGLDYSRMAHKLAERLQFMPKRTFWERLREAFFPKEDGYAAQKRF